MTSTCSCLSCLSILWLKFRSSIRLKSSYLCSRSIFNHIQCLFVAKLNKTVIWKILMLLQMGHSAYLFLYFCLFITSQDVFLLPTHLAMNRAGRWYTTSCYVTLSLQSSYKFNVWKNCQWLDLISGPPVLKAITMPSVPQPLALICAVANVTSM